jgi:hypothetical protein
MEASDARLLAANGTAIRVKGKATVEALAGSHRFEITGLVTDHVAKLMLGFDLLKELGAVWNFQKDEIQLAGVVHKLCSKERTGWCRRVILQSDCVVPSRSEAVLPTKVVYNDLTEVRSGKEPRWVTEAQELRSGLQVCRTVLPESDIDIPVRVMNVLSHPITLQVGAVISALEPVDVCGSEGDAVGECCRGDDPVLLDLVNRVDKSVNPDDRRRLLELLKEYSGAFSQGENDLGRTDVVTHTIDTADGRPIRQALRRHPPLHQEAISQHVRGMLEQGVIEPTRSP